MSNRMGKGGRGGKPDARNVEREQRRPIRTPYGADDRRSGRDLCRTYGRVDFAEVRRQHEDDTLDAREEKRERELLASRREDCRSLYMELIGDETVEQLEAMLDEHNRKRNQLRRADVPDSRLIHDPDVQREWDRYQDALQSARIWGLPVDQSTPLSAMEAAVRGEFDSAEDRMRAYELSLQGTDSDCR